SSIEIFNPKLTFKCMFLAALSFAYFAKALSGSYMKSTITQLERRFDISSYLIGIIDGSFEIGNLLVIAFVSYFGAKLHRPKIIAFGCVLMSFGTFLIAMPHFLIGSYKIRTAVRASVNSSNLLSPCLPGPPDSTVTGDCDRDSGVSMWIYVFLGNLLRGIGETPVQPLGISYIDDFARPENAAFYIGTYTTLLLVFYIYTHLKYSLLLLMNILNSDYYPRDARWVGAWFGYIISGVVTLMSAVPFWFLPKSLPVPVEKHDSSCSPEQTLLFSPDFVPTLKSLLGNPVYILYLCVTIIQFNSLIGMVTYKPKYIEQHYGLSASKANFLMGSINIPAVALGMFSGGVIMKKCKLDIMGAAKFAFGTSLLGYFLSLFFFAMGCENARVAGITVSYTGTESLFYQERSLYADCNSGCSCSRREWDPVCGRNGITYVSPCLAGCTATSGAGKNTVFERCRCVALPDALPLNLTAALGQCPRGDSCEQVFPYFLALSVLSSFIISLGGTPGFMLLVRCIKPELKSLALGIHTLATRTLAGIPAPIYFGAIIDSTCLKWGYKPCGGRGACRLYNTSAYRIVYLGLTLGLRTMSFFLCILGFAILKRHIRMEKKSSLAEGSAEQESLKKEESSEQFILALKCNADRETRL
uniref:Solute carrier organic anion transporter family member n=1 Tax=Neogobius melanostomus TaxID=47308 RepID=A0A8C6UFT8_9GOBI